MASRLSRLGARIINIILSLLTIWFMLPYVPLPSVRFALVIAGLGVITIIVQFVFLIKYGQSIGEKIFKIKIVKIQTGENGGFVTNIILRGLVNGIISIIPLYFLIDILFIFKSDRRCIHDLIAGTKVIKV